MELPVISHLKKEQRAGPSHLSSPPPLQSSERCSPNQPGISSPNYRQGAATSAQASGSSVIEDDDDLREVSEHRMPSAQVLMDLLEQYPTLKKEVVFGYLMSNSGDMRRVHAILQEAAAKGRAVQHRFVGASNGFGEHDTMGSGILSGDSSFSLISDDESEDIAIDVGPSFSAARPLQPPSSEMRPPSNEAQQPLRRRQPIPVFTSEGHQLGHPRQVLVEMPRRRRHSGEGSDSSRSDDDSQHDKRDAKRRCQKCGTLFSIVDTNNTLLCSVHLKERKDIPNRIRRQNFLERN